jgi:uncharacterized membrane protein YfcA
MALKEILVAVAGFVGGFVSILASNGSSVTLPALELFGLPEHAANGTNRLSVVALGLIGTIHFSREGLIDWRKGAWMAALVAAGTTVGSIADVDLSAAVLEAVVIAGLFLVLGMLLLRPSHWLRGKGGALRPFGWVQVDWAAGAPLALGSALGAYVAARLASKAWTRVWVYRFLVVAVLASIGYLLFSDSGNLLQLA